MTYYHELSSSRSNFPGCINTLYFSYASCILRKISSLGKLAKSFKLKWNDDMPDCHTSLKKSMEIIKITFQVESVDVGCVQLVLMRLVYLLCIFAMYFTM